MYLDQNKKKTKSMINLQFNYCPLVWMSSSRQSDLITDDDGQKNNDQKNNF